MSIEVVRMHAAIDPDGQEVWCDYAGQAAWTNDGFCQFCGATNHKPDRIDGASQDVTA